MSELGDTSDALQAHQERLDAHDARLAALETGMANVDRAQQTFESLIEIFRKGMQEECERLRRELRAAMNGR